MNDPDTTRVDDLFTQARTVRPVPSDDLMARVMADADMTAQADAKVSPRRNILATFLDLIGGWPAAGGLIAASLTGLWIGVSPPATLETYAAEMLGTTVPVTFFDEDLGFEIVDGQDG